jgi:hypothetical protein
MTQYMRLRLPRIANGITVRTYSQLAMSSGLTVKHFRPVTLSPPRAAIRSRSSYMQASRSLLQTGIKLQSRAATAAVAATGIAKYRAFLNVWGDKDQFSRPSRPSYQQRRTMASATTFFDFTPKDSKSLQSSSSRRSKFRQPPY